MVLIEGKKIRRVSFVPVTRTPLSGASVNASRTVPETDPTGPTGPTGTAGAASLRETSSSLGRRPRSCAWREPVDAPAFTVPATPHGSTSPIARRPPAGARSTVRQTRSS